MRNYKKLAAITMAATMLVGSGLTVFADNDQTSTGNGSYEGFIEEVSAFSVDVPTAAAQQFDFFVDPNDLLKNTGYARLGASATDFESGSTLFFTRTSGTKYGKDSDPITLTNMSSYEVNVEVSATVAGVDDITLSESADVSTAEGPTIYLAIASGGAEKSAIISTGGSYKDKIAGEPDNFEVSYDSSQSKYVFGLKKDTTEASPTAPWKTLSFNLTGACGGDWTDEQVGIAPSITLTWKITDPNADAAPSIDPDTYSYDRTQSLPITANLGNGSLAATAIKKVEASTNGTTAAGDYTSACAVNGNTFTLPSGKFGNASVGGKAYLIVTFDDAAATQVVVTLNITK